MTDIFDAFLAVVISLVVNFLIVLRLRRRVPGSDGQFLGRVYVWALVLRHVVAIFLNAYAGNMQFADAFWGDSGTYDYGGYFLSRTWAGESFFGTTAISSVSGFGFHYFVAVLYYFFGRNQLLVQFANATIGSLAIVVIYLIADHLFGARVARWSALFMGFFPQMVFWSCAIYKDPAILLCIALCMYAVLRLRERLAPGYVLLYVTSGLALMTLRFYVFYMVAFATLGTFLFAQRRGLFSGLFSQVVLVLTFAAAVAFGVRGETIESQAQYLDLDKLQTARQGQAILGRSAYGAEINVSTPAGALAALPMGVAYLLFAPFPWAISGVRQLMTLPETLVWYALMPALARGLIHVIKTRFRDALPILVFALTLTVAYGVFQSNVGTAYRQRTQITMFFFILMGVGIELRREQREARGRGLRPLASPGGARVALPR